jgi:hypothetical protein
MGENSEIHFSERRRFPRTPCAGAAEILHSGRCWGWGNVSDISLGGCYIEILHPLPVGSEAQLRLTIADTFVDVGAKVVLATPLVGMGMEFVVVSPEQGNNLARVVEQCTASDFSSTQRQDSATPESRPTHVQSALQHLQQALVEFQEAMGLKEEHCARALQLTENAIQEVNRVLEAAERHAEISYPTSSESGVAWREALLDHRL